MGRVFSFISRPKCGTINEDLSHTIALGSRSLIEKHQCLSETDRPNLQYANTVRWFCIRFFYCLNKNLRIFESHLTNSTGHTFLQRLLVSGLTQTFLMVLRNQHRFQRIPTQNSVLSQLNRVCTLYAIYI